MKRKTTIARILRFLNTMSAENLEKVWQFVKKLWEEDINEPTHL